MTTKSINNTNKYYMTYGEVLKFTIENLIVKQATYDNDDEVVECFKQTIIDVNDAIEDREILPIIISAPKSKIGELLYYYNLPEGLYRTLSLIILSALAIIIDHSIELNNKLQRINADLVLILIIGAFIAATVIFIVSIFKRKDIILGSLAKYVQTNRFG